MKARVKTEWWTVHAVQKCMSLFSVSLLLYVLTSLATTESMHRYTHTSTSCCFYSSTNGVTDKIGEDCRILCREAREQAHMGRIWKHKYHIFRVLWSVSQWRLRASAGFEMHVCMCVCERVGELICVLHKCTHKCPLWWLFHEWQQENSNGLANHNRHASHTCLTQHVKGFKIMCERFL